MACLILAPFSSSWVTAGSGGLAGGGLVVTTVIGFMPAWPATGDIGNWGEALGIASLLVGGSFLMLTAGVLGFRVPESAHAVGAEPERARCLTSAAA